MYLFNKHSRTIHKPGHHDNEVGKDADLVIDNMPALPITFCDKCFDREYDDEAERIKQEMRIGA